MVSREAGVICDPLPASENGDLGDSTDDLPPLQPNLVLQERGLMWQMLLA